MLDVRNQTVTTDRIKEEMQADAEEILQECSLCKQPKSNRMIDSLTWVGFAAIMALVLLMGFAFWSFVYSTDKLVDLMNR